jgi:hypothetical protein
MAIDRRFADFAAHLATLAGYPPDVCVKHDRGALVSVDCRFADFGARTTALVFVHDDEALEHLALEFDRDVLVSVDIAAVMDHCALDEMSGALCAAYIDARVAAAAIVFFNLAPRTTIRPVMASLESDGVHDAAVRDRAASYPWREDHVPQRQRQPLLQQRFHQPLLHEMMRPRWSLLLP